MHFLDVKCPVWSNLIENSRRHKWIGYLEPRYVNPNIHMSSDWFLELLSLNYNVEDLTRTHLNKDQLK